MSQPEFDAPVVALFDGQGVLKPGAGQEVWRKYGAAREVILAGSDAIGVDLTRVCFERGDLGFLINQTQIAQPATATISIAECRAWCEQYEQEPDYVTGLSMGLWSALSVAGTVEKKTRLEKDHMVIGLLARRGQIIHDVNQANESNGQAGGMAAILGHLRPELAKMLPEGLKVGVSRVGRHQILTGYQIALSRFIQEHLPQMGERRLRKLDIVGALHHESQAPAQEPLREELIEVVTLDPEKQFLGNNETDGYLGTANEVIDHLIKQLVEEAQWDWTVQRLALDGVGYAVEFGPDTKRGLLKDAKEAGIRPIEFPKAA